LLRNLSNEGDIAIQATTEVIGPGAFEGSSTVRRIAFANGTELKEIGEAGFARCWGLRTFGVPSSVETIGDRCFEKCTKLGAITFGDSSKLKRIGARAFAESRLTSFTIPASTEKIDGSAFIGCPVREIGVAPGSRNFTANGNLLLTSEGTEIVRYFGRELEVIVPRKVEILGKSCFEDCDRIESLLFENGSKLQRIGRSSLSGCSSLRGISIPVSVEVIEEAALRGCSGLESCLIAEDANLARIRPGAFAECRSLRSFYIPRSVEAIGENCFYKCVSLHRLRFASSESLNQLVGNCKLDEVLETVGLGETLSLLIIEIGDHEMQVEFLGWSSVRDDNSYLILVQDIP
jgi:hypothetical protein